MHNQTRIESAAEAGRAAFEAGKMAVPALDGNVLELIKGCVPGEAIEVLDAWTRAWHTANLAAPVEGL